MSTANRIIINKYFDFFFNFRYRHFTVHHRQDGPQSSAHSQRPRNVLRHDHPGHQLLIDGRRPESSLRMDELPSSRRDDNFLPCISDRIQFRHSRLVGRIVFSVHQGDRHLCLDLHLVGGRVRDGQAVLQLQPPPRHGRHVLHVRDPLSFGSYFCPAFHQGK